MEKIRVILRYANLSDANDIIKLVSKLDRPYPANKYERGNFNKLIKNYVAAVPKGNKGIILAIIQSEIIGLVSYVLLDRLNQQKTEFWIPEIVVSNEYRGRGIGKLLIKKCESIGKRKRCYRIRLESRNDKIDSHEFYKKIGFQQIALMFEKFLE